MTDQTKSKMEAALNHLAKELGNLRTGRANPSILDGVNVEVYGANMRIRDLANVTTPEPRQILITPFDRTTAGPISKGIEKANIGLQPILEEGIVRVNVPPMDEQQRRDTVKFGKKKAEEAKVAIREIRRKSNEQLDNDKNITEDQARGGKKKVQELTDDYCKQIDEMFAKKEKEIMTI
ncbi:MAG TPA: ribosome recycling factor [Chlamydiales bacterium]|nr:ribosome recycling factor [Chlamydiales bacterium]HPE84838.1 ribosome recycling factor [Chlamydiales bacterium]